MRIRPGSAAVAMAVASIVLTLGATAALDTLVVDVTAQNDRTWFDRSGNFHSDALHVVERYAPLAPDALAYEATIEDSKVFSRPWKISMPLYRRLEKNAQVFEFKCVEFVEELMYGHLRRQPNK